MVLDGKHLLEILETISLVLHLFSSFGKRYIVSSFLSPKTTKIIFPLLSCLHLVLFRIKSDSKSLKNFYTSRKQPREGDIATWVPLVLPFENIEYTLTGPLGWTLLQY